MRTQALLSALAIAFSCGVASAEDPRPCVLRPPEAPAVVLSGNARIDFAGPGDPLRSLQEQSEAATPGKKSPWLAGGLSLAIPGAGEFYTESYLKSALFIAAEAVLWVLAYNYDHKGDRQTDFFQNYANAHWSVVRYAEYAQTHLAPSGGNYQVILPGAAADPAHPWMYVNWAELNRMESDIGATATGSYYSHVLPAYNSQQYYELVGKYPQFNQGWDDAPASFAYGDRLSSESLYYDGERGQANTYYTRASTFVGIALINHVVSAIDAALSAGSYNRGLHASVAPQTVPASGGYTVVPVLRLTWGL